MSNDTRRVLVGAAAVVTALTLTSVVSAGAVEPALAAALASPSVTIDQAVTQIDPTSTSPIGFTAVFSENVTGFTGADVNLASSTAGGTLIAAVTGGPTTYSVKVSGMTSSGTVVVSIPPGAAIDASSNPSTASTSTDNSVAWAPDTTKPDVSINQAVSQVDPTSASPIGFTAVFSENVTGFTGADVNLSSSTAGGTLIAAVTGGPTTYSVKVSGMTSSGNVVVSIPASAAEDASNNPSNASTSTDNNVAWIFSNDTTKPDVRINQAAAQPDPTSVSPIVFTATFSEPVSGFTAADVRLGQSTAGGSLVAAVNGGPTVYTVKVSGMTTSGVVVASIPAGAAQDLAANQSTASTSDDNLVSWKRSKPPGTRITKARIKVHAGSARFSFVATGRATGFQCALAKGHATLHFTSCRSPRAYSHLSKGSYTFAVRAVGPGGKDKTPATRRFTSKR